MYGRLRRSAHLETMPDRTPTTGGPKPTGPWLTYEEAAAYTGWSVGHLRNLVSAGQIPVYGHPRSRRFRRDMVDLYLTDRDVAMRLFHQERGNTHGR